MVNFYIQEDLVFKQKCEKLYHLHRTQLKAFNLIFQAELTRDLVPSKSVEIMKVFFRCQLPYEMFFCLHETTLMATEELANHF